MTDQERGAATMQTLVEMVSGVARAIEAQDQRFDAIERRLDRIEKTQADHGSALRAHLEQLHAIRVVLTGDRAQHYQLGERLAELERKAG